MKDSNKTKEQLIRELTELRQRIKEMENSEEKHRGSDVALSENEAEYRSFIELANDAIYIITSQGFEYVNSAFEKLTGFKVEEVCNDKFDFLSIIVPEDREMIKQRRKAREKGDKIPSRYEFRIIARDGTVKHVEATTVETGEKKEVKVMGILRDITERRRIEEVLRREHRQLLSIFESTNNPIYVSDPETHEVLYINQALKESVGDVIGKKCYESFQARKSPCPFCTNEHIFGQNRGKSYTWEFQNPFIHRWYRCTDKAIRWPDGRMVRYEMAIDITDQKQAEEALRESEQKFRSIAECSPNMIFINKKGRIVYANKRCEEIMGYKQKEFYSLDFDFLNLISLESRGQLMKSFNQHLKGHELEPYEYSLITKDGRIIDSIITTKLIDYEAEKAILGIVTDITKRKRAEKKMRASLKEKEVLLLEIHHRAKNNMQVISSLLNLQSLYVKDKNALEMFRETQDRVRLMVLVHEKLYRSDDVGKINFVQYTKELATYLYQSYCMDQEKIKMKMNVDGVFLDINTAVPCGLIINELITNSLKHAFPNGRKGEVCLDLFPVNNSKYCLTVRDNGVQFPKNINFRKTETLGMQLVNLLVEQLEGTVMLRRKEGTEFKISFNEVHK